MKKMILILMLVIGTAQYIESVNGVYYPNCEEVVDFTDLSLELGVK